MVNMKRSGVKSPHHDTVASQRHGGWEITHIEAKCWSLLLCLIYIQGRKAATITGEWMRKWRLTGEQNNPPQERRVLEKLKYFHV